MTSQQVLVKMAASMLNFNIGVLGHVDSGKTSLAKALSTVASTASFDKNPQSKERGITLDLGFSSFTVDLPEHLKAKNVTYDKLQFTLVDCPGHASLIRTIIGGNGFSMKGTILQSAIIEILTFCHDTPLVTQGLVSLITVVTAVLVI